MGRASRRVTIGRGHRKNCCQRQREEVGQGAAAPWEVPLGLPMPRVYDDAAQPFMTQMP
jgi:hypothetical protein